MNNGTNGWTVEGTMATRHRSGHETELEIGAEYLSIEVEQGSGYLAQHTSTYIPIEVLAELFRQAGWTCTAPPSR